MKISEQQKNTLLELASVVEGVDPAMFNMNAPYVRVEDDAVADVSSVAADPSVITAIDAAGLLITIRSPKADDNWHSFVLRETGHSDHTNAHAWGYMFGTVMHQPEDLTPAKVAERIRRVANGQRIPVTTMSTMASSEEPTTDCWGSDLEHKLDMEVEALIEKINTVGTGEVTVGQMLKEAMWVGYKLGKAA